MGVLRPGQALAQSKQAAFAATWDSAGAPVAVAVREVAAGMDEAMATEAAQREDLARGLAKSFRGRYGAVHDS